MSTKTVWITGASSGIGREFARRYARLGFRLILTARRRDRLETLAAELRAKHGTLCRIAPADLEQDAQVAALCEALADERIDLFINNAGFGTFGPIAAQRPEDGANMAKLLMVAPVELIYRTLPYYRAGSRVINVASVAAFLPQPKLAVYSAAKRFILDLSRSLNAELGEADIHVTALCPKFMHTEFLDQPGDQAAANAMCAIGFERAEDVARSALRASNRGKDLCIPSLDMKAYYAASRILPYKAALAVERALGIL